VDQVHRLETGRISPAAHHAVVRDHAQCPSVAVTSDSDIRESVGRFYSSITRLPAYAASSYRRLDAPRCGPRRRFRLSCGEGTGLRPTPGAAAVAFGVAEP
jgi:hypothetical protein